jgi:uncharacterized protein YlxW (UPF0749 family)
MRRTLKTRIDQISKLESSVKTLDDEVQKLNNNLKSVSKTNEEQDLTIANL